MPKPDILFHKTYLAVIRNSVGTKIYRNFYLKIDGKVVDAAKNGACSCAFFVSNILHMFPAFALVKEPHLTVASTVADLKNQGWTEIKKPLAGAILVWEEKLFGNSRNKHIGFYIGNNKAISNDSQSGSPAVHHWTYGEKNGKPVRKVEMILWHPRF